MLIHKYIQFAMNLIMYLRILPSNKNLKLLSKNEENKLGYRYLTLEIIMTPATTYWGAQNIKQLVKVSWESNVIDNYTSAMWLNIRIQKSSS